MSRALRCSDYTYVMLEGRIVLEGVSSQLTVDQVNDAYFGIGIGKEE